MAYYDYDDPYGVGGGGSSFFEEVDTTPAPVPTANYDTREEVILANGQPFNYGAVGSPTEAINRNNPTAALDQPYVQEGDTGGFLVGKGVTVGQGRSLTQAEHEAYINEARAQGIPESFIQAFLGVNAYDSNRLVEAYYSSGGSNDPTVLAKFGSGAPQAMQPFSKQFSRPTTQEVTDSATFQFRLGEAMNAIKRAGLAKGVAGTNQVWKALQEQASGIGADEYEKEYNRRWNEYTGEADIYFQNESNRYSSERTNRMDDYTIEDGNRNFDRLTDLDEWSQGTDIWNMNRQAGLDDFNQNMTVAEFLQKYRPQPA